MKEQTKTKREKTDVGNRKSSRQITNLKRSEEALLVSELKYRRLFEAAKDGILILDYETGTVVDVNPFLIQLLGLKQEEILGKKIWELGFFKDVAANQANFLELQQKEFIRYENLALESADGQRRNVEFVSNVYLVNSHKVIQCNIRDITERKRSEEKIKTILRTAMDGFYMVDMEGRILEANDSYCSMIGYSREELLKMSVKDVEAVETEEVIKKRIQRIIENGSDRFETMHRRKDGSVLTIEASVKYLKEEPGSLVVFMRDITERKRMEEALTKEQYNMQAMMDYLPSSIYFKDRASRFTRISKSQSLRFGLSDPALAIGKTDFDFFTTEHAQPAYEDEQAIIRTGHPLIKEEKETWTDRPDKWVLTTKMPMRDNEGNIIGTFGISTDITEHKQMEEALAQEKSLLRSLIDNVPDYVYVKDTQSRFLVANPALARVIGAATPDELLGKTDFDFFPQELAAKYYADEQAIFQSGQPVLELEEPAVDAAGNKIWVSSTKILLKDAQGNIFGLVGMGHDITRRKQSEQAIRQHITELETLYESGLVFGQLLSPKEVAHKLIDLMAAKLDWHHTAIRLYHAEDETLELMAFNLPVTISTEKYRAIEERFKTLIAKAGDGLAGWTVQHRQVVRIGELTHDSRYVETEPNLHSGMYIPLRAGERVVGVISIESEMPHAFSEADEHFVITLANQAAVALENSRLHEETLRQLKRLKALHAIDQSIGGSFDQRSTLDVLLTHTLDQLEADAAVVLLLEPYQRTLQYAVGKGFHTRTIETTNYKLSESLARQAIMERRMIHISDQEARELNPALADLWLEEGFKSMDAASLISKGIVKGVLNIYHRKSFTPSPAWSSFLETLAGQAAIAVESTQLFNGLQQANMELAVAYDATIEGWSRAMDLRDRETEGHTERVMEMSMQLGKAMELGEEYLVHLRRGALLHDMGKLGVPDAILFKADKLTDEEWEIMKKHPQFAYDMLYSIKYLHRALDIPYCHHEKWDGTGYPRGLKAEQIPLAARIFAIVDVWDALTSDRPYRRAWSKPDALKYIHEQSGKHFDPQVVDIFLKEFEHE